VPPDWQATASFGSGEEGDQGWTAQAPPGHPTRSRSRSVRPPQPAGPLPAAPPPGPEPLSKRSTTTRHPPGRPARRTGPERAASVSTHPAPARPPLRARAGRPCRARPGRPHPGWRRRCRPDGLADGGGGRPGGGSTVGRPGERPGCWPTGGGAVHGLLDEEVEAILEPAGQWGEIDRSHRKLAHRGSTLGRVWVSPASVWRVLVAHDLVLPKPPGRWAGAAHALAGLVGVSPQPGVGLGCDPLRPLPGRPGARWRSSTWSAASGWPPLVAPRRPPPRSRWCSVTRWGRGAGRAGGRPPARPGRSGDR
jgi:hypothetical protein